MAPAMLDLVYLRGQPGQWVQRLRGVGTRSARKVGEIEERLATVAARREAPYFSDAERVALALAEAVTRLADRPGPVPGEVGMLRAAGV
jgi:hypothetical protein